MNLRRPATVVSLAVGVPLSLLFLWLAGRSTNLSLVWTTLKAAKPGDVLLSVAAMCSVYVVQAIRWRVIAAGRASRRNYVGLVVGGVAANNVLPGRIGDVFRGVWLARLEQIPSGRALATVVYDRASDVMALVVLLAISLPFTVRPTWLLRIVVGGVILALLITAFLVAAHVFARLHERTERVRSRARRVARDLLDGLASPPSPGRAVVALALSLAAWGIWTVGAWLAARSLGIELSALDSLLVAAVVNLGVAIPSSPGFIGTYQWLCVSTLSLLGIDKDQALAFSILLHASWYVPTTLAGSVYVLWRLARRVKTRPLETAGSTGSAPRSSV
jgi:uncharacterized protein (TIRG00374 family)